MWEGVLVPVRKEGVAVIKSGENECMNNLPVFLSYAANITFLHVFLLSKQET